MEQRDAIKEFKRNLSDTISDVCISHNQWKDIMDSYPCKNCNIKLQAGMKDEIERTLIKNLKERLKLPM